MTKVKRKAEEILKNKSWWDKECGRKKREVRKLLRKWKEGKEAKEKYLRESTEFRKICKRKQKEKAKSELEEIRKAKTEKEIWRYINKGRKQRIPISEAIGLKEWRKYFMELLNGTDRKRENMWKNVVQRRNTRTYQGKR